MKRAKTVCWTGCLLISMCAGASRADAPARDHELEPEDYFTIAGLRAVDVSPDGRHVAYTEQRWEPPDERRNTDLWVVDTSNKETLRLTFDKANEGAPHWSPDGRYIYFTSNYKRAGEDKPPYDGKRQVWRIRPEGGEPLAVTRVKDGIQAYELSRDGDTLYYMVAKKETEDEWKDMRDKYEDLKYGHGVTKFSQIWKLDLRGWRTEKLIDEKRVILDMAVSPDESRIAMVTTPDEELIHREGWSRVDVYDTKTKEIQTVTGENWREDHSSPFGWLNEVTWSSDSKAVAFSVDFDGYPGRMYVAEWIEGEPKMRELTRPDGVTVRGGSLEWRGQSRDLCFTAEERARVRVHAITEVRGGEQGPAKTLTPGDEMSVGTYDFAPSGDTLVVTTASLTNPGDLYMVEDGGGLDRLTKINPQVDTWKLPQISLVQWTGDGGDEVEGILELPPDYKPEDGPLPMVVEIHGGPTAATIYKFRFWIYGRALLPAKGYAVLSPNYHGSTGYGDKFMTDLIGRENDIEVKDILAGVDAMVERGIADPTRLGVMGWSNGGFLTNCLITQTDRFKAASSGAGVIDQVIQWGTEDTPGHVINYMEGNLPWADPTEYLAGSPLYSLDKVVTPTLVHVGENDARVPAAHSQTLYRALKHYLKIPTELIVYPGEGHGLTTYKHRKAKMEWDVAWFDRYILDKPTEDPKPEVSEPPAS